MRCHPQHHLEIFFCHVCRRISSTLLQWCHLHRRGTPPAFPMVTGHRPRLASRLATTKFRVGFADPMRFAFKSDCNSNHQPVAMFHRVCLTVSPVPVSHGADGVARPTFRWTLFFGFVTPSLFCEGILIRCWTCASLSLSLSDALLKLVPIAQRIPPLMNRDIDVRYQRVQTDQTL